MKHVWYKSDRELESFSFGPITISKCIWIDGKPFFTLNAVCELLKIPRNEKQTLIQLLKNNIENYGEYILPVLFENVAGIEYAIEPISLFVLHSNLQYEQKENNSKQLVKLLSAYCNNQLHQAMNPSSKMKLVIQKIHEINSSKCGKRVVLVKELCKKTGKSRATIERWIKRYNETGSIGYYYHQKQSFQTLIN